MARFLDKANREIDWENMLYSTIGGVIGGVGGTMTNIFGVPLGIGGHVATEYFANDDMYDLLGKGISNGLIGGGLGSFIMTTSAQNLGTRSFTSENLAQYGEGDLNEMFASPSLWAYEQLIGSIQSAQETVSGTTEDTTESFYGYIE